MPAMCHSHHICHLFTSIQQSQRSIIYERKQGTALQSMDYELRLLYLISLLSIQLLFDIKHVI